MIRFNLTPLEELESPYWFVPDLVIGCLVGFLAYAAVNSYLEGIREQAAAARAQTETYKAAMATLQPQIDQFADLDKQAVALKSRIENLKLITESKIERYTPLIALEHYHNLKPHGVWYDKFTLDAKVSTIKIQGHAFSNLLVAELMAALNSTRVQDADPSDLRTLVYFESVSLDSSAHVAKNIDFPDIDESVKFSLETRHKERLPEPEVKLPTKTAEAAQR